MFDAIRYFFHNSHGMPPGRNWLIGTQEVSAIPEPYFLGLGKIQES